MRLLHLEDDPLDAELIQETLLAEGLECEVTQVDSREGFLAAIEQGGFEAILADFSLPAFDGLTALEIAQEKCPGVPFIFVSGAIGEELAIETLKKGATDYVLKHRLGRLAPALRRALSEVEERQGRAQATEALQQSRSQLEAIVSGIAEAILVQAADGRLVYVNEMAAQMLGDDSPAGLLAVPFAEVMGNFELFDEEGQPLPIDALPNRQALRGERSPEVLIRFRRRETGEENWWLCNARPVFDAEGQVQFAVNIFRDLTERMHMLEAERQARARAEASRQRLDFLASVSKTLVQSLDYERMLQQVVQLTVPWFADWCAVNLVAGEGHICRVALASVDSIAAQLVQETTQDYPTRVSGPGALFQVLRSGETAFYPEIDEQMIGRMQRSAAHGEMLRRLRLRSCIIAPLKVREQVIGAFTFALSDSGRHYDEEDVALAEEVAHRTASVLDNIQLYQEATRLNEELEQRVARRTEELRITNRQLERKIHEHQQAEAMFRSLLESAPDAMVIMDQDGRVVLVNSQTEMLFDYAAAELVGQAVEILVPQQPDAPLSPRKFYQQPHLWDMRSGLELYGRRRDGRFFPVEISLSPLVTDEATLIIAAMRDVTVRKETERALRNSEETTRALLSLSTKLNSTLDPAALLDALVEETINLTNTEGGFAGINTPAGLAIKKCLHQGKVVDIEMIWPAGYGLPGRLLENRQAYLINDVSQDEASQDEAGIGLFNRFAIRSRLGTPILSNNGEVLGFFEVYNKHDGAPFTEEDERKLAGAAQIAAIALQNAQSYRKLQDLSRRVVSAQEEEQRRLSRELHDSAGQLLTVLQIHLSLLAEAIGDDSELSGFAQEAIELTTTLHDEIRAISHGLRPPAVQFEDYGLNETLRRLCLDFSKRISLPVIYEGVDTPTMPDQISVSFYRFLQEALNNVAKHAQASSVRVALNCDEQEISLIVEDDGVGIASTNLPMLSRSSGVGLLGLRERFELIGGKVQVESKNGKGTRVSAQYRIQQPGGGLLI